MKKSKFFKTLAVFGACLGAPLLLTGCQSGDADFLEFRVQDGYVQYTKDGKTWENIISSDDLKGKDGSNGEDGKGIKSIRIDQTRTDSTKTTYIITFDDGSKFSYVVKNGTNGEDGEDGKDGKDGSVVTIGEDGYWYIDGVKSDVKAKGEDGINGTNGEDGEDGNGIKSIDIDQVNSDSTKTTYIITFDDGSKFSYVVKNGINGQNGTNGEDGEDGKDGKDGSVVTIGEDGYWYIDGVKSDVKAKGEDGINGTNGQDGEDGNDGVDGNDGLTPFIGENGNWWIGETDTGVVARKEDITITLKYDSSLRFSDETIESTIIDRYNYQSELICSHGESLILPLPTNVFGYEFEGWYSTTDGVVTANDSKITNMTVFTKSITLVPKFKGYEETHQIEKDGVIYSYRNYTTISKISFKDSDTGIINIPYGTKNVSLTDSSSFTQDEYTLTIPDTIYNGINLCFDDFLTDYETGDSTALISDKVKTLSIQCENETSEFELANIYPFINVENVYVSGIVTMVYVETFKDYSNLTTLTDSTSTNSEYVELNKCSYIGDSAFENTNIKEISFNFDCKTQCYIGEKAFRNCSNLSFVHLGNKSDYAIRTSGDIFYGCSKLMQVSVRNVNTDIELPESEFNNRQWNMCTGTGTLLDSDVTTILKDQQEIRMYKNESAE